MRLKVGRLHYRIKCVRMDFLHKLSRSVVQKYGRVVLEDLNVAAMAKGKNLMRKSVGDLGLSEFRRQVEYKAEVTGTKLVLAARKYPSTKTCSACGFVNDEVVLGVKKWECPQCKTPHHRDQNAALNLEQIPTGSGKSTPAEIGGSPAKRKSRGGDGLGSRNSRTNSK